MTHVESRSRGARRDRAPRAVAARRGLSPHARLGRLVLTCVLAALALPLAACSGSEAKEVVIVDNQRPAQARRQFGPFSLGASEAESRSIAERFGWAVSADAEDANKLIVQLPAGDAASRYRLLVESGKVVQIAIDYSAMDDARIELRHSYAVSRVRPDGGWAMTDTHRQTLVIVGPHGATLVAIDLEASRDKTGVRALLERMLGE